MRLDEVVISRAIVESYSKQLVDHLELDVAIVGAGPAGMVAGYYAAKEGLKVALFERRLSPGGGMWGGGIMFNQIVVQDEARQILDEMGVSSHEYQEGYFVADSVEATAALCYNAVKAGAKLFNLLGVEDVLVQEEQVRGLVINWSAVNLANLHVDPISVRSKLCVDATGHECSVVTVLQKKVGPKLNTATGQTVGEGPMDADAGEKTIVKNTKEVYPGLFVAGMACNAVFGGPRMGPIFGGMLLSGQKVAKLVADRLGGG